MEFTLFGRTFDQIKNMYMSLYITIIYLLASKRRLNLESYHMLKNFKKKALWNEMSKKGDNAVSLAAYEILQVHLKNVMTVSF